MATWHAEADPVLFMDITALAATVSAVVVRFETKEKLGSEPEKGETDFIALETPGIQGAYGSRIATIIIPHDASWLPSSSLPASSAVRMMLARMDDRSKACHTLSEVERDREADMVRAMEPTSKATILKVILNCFCSSMKLPCWFEQPAVLTKS